MYVNSIYSAISHYRILFSRYRLMNSRWRIKLSGLLTVDDGKQKEAQNLRHALLSRSDIDSPCLENLHCFLIQNLLGVLVMGRFLPSPLIGRKVNGRLHMR